MMKYLIIVCFLLVHVVADMAEWKREIDQSLARNIKFAKWRFVDEHHPHNKTEKAEQVASPDTFFIRRLFPSKLEVKSYHQVPATLTTANEGLGVTAQKRGYSYEKWGNDPNSRWEIPDTHPGQDKRNCINMTLLASTGNIYAFYEGFKKIDRAFYTVYAKQGFIHPSGAVGNSGGYYMGQEACENRWDYAKKWYEGCKDSLKRQEMKWEDLFSNRTSTEKFQKVIDGCTDSTDLGIPTARGATFKVTKHAKVFVIPALWDFNYHHFMADSLARMIRYYRYLKKHTDILIHVRAFEEYDALHKHDMQGQKKAKAMRKGFFELLGISSSRLISGPVLADEVLIPRCLRCAYALSNPIEIRVLTKTLLTAAKAFLKHHPQLYPNITQIAYLPPTTSTSPTKTSEANINMNTNASTPPKLYNMIVQQRRGHQGDRSWDDRTFQEILFQLSQQFPYHNIIPISSKNLLTDSYCLACDLYLYSKADILFGAHGAGLTNMMFMPTDSLVVEVVGETKDVNMPVCGYYGPYAAIFGHHHYIDAFYYEGGERVNPTQIVQKSRKFYTFLRENSMAQRKMKSIEIVNSTAGYPYRP
jgi:hypothetical protein